MSIDKRKKEARNKGRQLEETYGKRAGRPVLDALALPEDTTGRAARMVLSGNRRLLVENCRGILQFSRTLIRLAVPGGSLTISGTALRLSDARAESLCVEGEFTALEFPRAGGPDD